MWLLDLWKVEILREIRFNKIKFQDNQNRETVLLGTLAVWCLWWEVWDNCIDSWSLPFLLVQCALLSKIIPFRIKPSIILVRPAKTDRMCLLQPPSYPKRHERETLPFWVDTLADLSVCWSHRSYCRLCRAHIKRNKCGANVVISCTIIDLWKNVRLIEITIKHTCN